MKPSTAGSLTRTVLVSVVLLDCVFKPLTAFLFLEVIGAPLRQGFALIAGLNALVVLVALFFVAWMLGPVRACEEASARGVETSEQVAAAFVAACAAPERFALGWTGHWLVVFAPLAPLLQGAAGSAPPQVMVSAVLLLVAIALGGWPLSFALMSFLIGPTLGRLSLAARAKRVVLNARGLSLTQTLTRFALCLSLAPTAFLSALAFSAHARAAAVNAASIANTEPFVVSLVVFAVTVTTFAALCGALLAHNIARPTIAIAGALRKVTESGESLRGGELPVTYRDELGELTESANDLIDRLVSARSDQSALAKLELSYAEVNQASRAKSEFLANMSHEIRTPLAAVIGYADLLLEPSTTPAERLSHVQTIRRNGTHLLSLLNDILDLSKIESGKMTVESVLCQPHQIIVDVVSLMRVRAVEKELSFGVEYLTPIPQLIRGDPTRIRQVLTNLVGNAIKFTQSGGVKLLVSADPPTAPRPRLSIEVVDTGIGMDAQELSKLFQPFVQADSSTTRKYGGSGLGLAISQRLATMMGGQITVQSERDVGSSFTFTLDTGPLDGIAMITGPSETSVRETVTPPPPSRPRAQLACSVLLAEDGPDNRLLISTILRAAGATVTMAEDGRIAVDLALAANASGTAFDVILMDMQMPKLDGYEATGLLRAAGYRGPIVALTAHAMSGDRERCLAAGCSDYLSKPITRAGLIATVAKQIEQNKKPSAPPVTSEYSDDNEMQDVIRQFVAGLPKRIATLRDAFERGDLDAVAHLAHQLKGAAGGFGFSTISELAHSISAPRESDSIELSRRLAELTETCSRVRVSRVPGAVRTG